MLLLAALVLPGLIWEGPAPAGFDKVWAPGDAELAKAMKADAPGVQRRFNIASATTSPWVTTNGWRFKRDPQALWRYHVPETAAPIAAAEAYMYGVRAAIHVDGAVEKLAEMLTFLRRIDATRAAEMVNIGVVDDGSDASAEAMNLLTRRNLLFRIVKAPDPKLDLNVRGTDAKDPYEFAVDVRHRLTDEKRLLRLYGSEVVIGRLEGDRSHGRLHLLNYANRPVGGLRVRVRGSYGRIKVAAMGGEDRAEEVTVVDGGTEFTLPRIGAYTVIDLDSK